MTKPSVRKAVDKFNTTYAIGESVHYYRGPGDIGIVTTLQRQAWAFNGRTAVCEVAARRGIVPIKQIGRYVDDPS